MTVTGLFRLLAPSGMFLLATTTTTVFTSLPRAGATSSAGAADVDDTATDLCPAELQACNEDPTCSGCISVTETSSTEFKDCETAGSSSMSSSASICIEGRQAMCCIDELSEFDCMGNDVYVAYVACLLVESGCSAEDISCNEEQEFNSKGGMSLGATEGGAEAATGEANSSSSSSISGSSIAITVAFAFVFFAAGVGVGVVMSKKCMPDSRAFTRIK
ncbi:unnamed protein product [Laminaria digitata]